MESTIYQDIARRTQGDVYVGVVGPVRTGKSTFIKKFMETVVIPHIDSEFRKERAVDELPQSAAGRTIMTTEPKFIPEEAVTIAVEEHAKINVRLIDCVGYIVPSSLGYIENEMPRMVVTPWFDEEVPFNMAAEVGTRKVITEHSTVGIVVTTDGSISDIPRDEYAEAEDRVISELKEMKKPFVVLLNCVNPQSEASKELAADMSRQYEVPVVPMSCVDLTESDIKLLMKQILYQFPVKEIAFSMPKWVNTLSKDHWLKTELFTGIRNAARHVQAIEGISSMAMQIQECDSVTVSSVDSINLGTGSAKLRVQLKESLFYRVLEEETGLSIAGESGLMPMLKELAAIRKEYEKFKGALEEVEATGYGIVMPTMDQLSLEEPEIMKQGGRYGVRLRANAPSIHLMKANITTEVNPIVGTESQSEDLINYLLQEFEESPQKIWDSNIFGKSLHELVNEGLHNKLYRMPPEARLKMQETIERIINEGCSGLICIIL
ncbi:stage IV sporulation protein A [Massiliimalia massiliensis]|uniref:stage IV sporulation protein A n=1 Tax=Massiliimalia massiliensis TaxID=1852384 RepID=UPI000985A9ED|nr:stage IV sporulation protein A [Massiliimalia massiliensis]